MKTTSTFSYKLKLMPFIISYQQYWAISCLEDFKQWQTDFKKYVQVERQGQLPRRRGRTWCIQRRTLPGVSQNSWHTVSETLSLRSFDISRIYIKHST